MRVLLTLLIALGLAAPAHATPPDVANVRDEIVGVNESHVFVLRTTNDNLGSHYESRSEVFLVAIDLATAEEEYWPLYGVTQTTDFGDDGTDDRVITTPDDQTGFASPYAILAARGALPWQAPGDWWKAPDITRSSAGLKITYEGGGSFALTESDLAARLTASVTSITANITNHPRLASIDTKEIFAELDMGLDHCQFTEPAHYYMRGSEAPSLLIRMTCGDEDGLGGTSLIVPVPPALRP